MMKRFAALLLAAVLLAASAVFTGAGAEFDLRDFLPSSSVSVGEYVYFGSFDQDSISGKEPIQWVVLDVSGNKALLMSRYGLECKPFHSNSGGQTWDNCSLRTWLNGSFYNTAFSKEERDAIEKTFIDESSSQCSPAFPPARLGKDTNDNVFILSYAETVKYLMKSGNLMCIPTDHTVANGGNRSGQAFLNGMKTCWYWLRSPAHKNCVLGVNWDGTISAGYISQAYGVVRPCIWVDINKAF